MMMVMNHIYIYGVSLPSMHGIYYFYDNNIHTSCVGVYIVLYVRVSEIKRARLSYWGPHETTFLHTGLYPWSDWSESAGAFGQKNFLAFLLFFSWCPWYISIDY